MRMRRLFTILASIVVTVSLWAQSPEKMSYQAVIRNSGDSLVRNTQIGMQISILQGAVNGTAVYVETQSPTSNANGLVSVEIGTGITSDDFASIDWANGPYFIKTEIDPTGGSNYTIIGTSQLLSVPYALHAKTADVLTGGITETDPAYTASQAAKITSTDITNLGNLSGVNTGDQDLSGLATKTEVTAGLATKVDKEAGKGLSTNDYTSAEKTKLAAISGTNTGDQDLTGLATKTALADSTAKVRSEIPDVSGFLSAETDPAYTASQAAKITATDITNLGNLSGTNTGDQDLTGLATKTEVTAGLATKVDVEAGKGLSTNDYTSAEKTKLAAISGTNTGDQDLSGLATKTEVTAGLATKVDKEAGKGLSTNDYTSAEKTKLAAISGTNTGDQDLSALATKTEVATGLATKVDIEAGKGLSTNDYTSAEKTKLAAISGTNTGDQDLSALATETEVATDLATKVDVEAGKGLSTNDYTSAEKTKLAAISGTNTGDQDLSGLATKTEVTAGLATKVDKEAGKGLSTNDYTSAEKTKLAAISGTNTGDQDLTGLATKTALADSTAKVRSEIPDVSGFLSAETDPAYTASQAAKITATDITNLGNLSGVNTGDQDLTGLATKTEVTAGLATKVDVEAGKGLSTNDYTSAEKTKLAAISGTNTGDQDLSGLATKTEVTAGLAKVRSEIPDVSGFLSAETDPAYTASQAAKITSTD